MFIGHWAPALVAATHPKAPKLGTLFVAAQLVDIAFFSLVLLGVEHMRLQPGISVMNPMDLYHMPYTHSLLGGALWAAGFAGLLWLGRRSMVAALIAAAVVLSHWFLDLLVHIPDLTLAGGEAKLGLGLWNHPWIEMPLEIALTAGALAFYLRRTRSVSPRSGAALALLVVMLAAVQAFNWFGPPPQQVNLASAGMVLGTYVAMALAAMWLAGTRTLRPAMG